MTLPHLPSPWRDLWPAIRDGHEVYLNAAGEGPLSTIGEEALQAYLRDKRTPQRKDLMRAFWVPAQIRERAAQVCGVDPAGGGVVTSTNYGVNLLAQGIAWQPGDRVLCFAGEFPACVYPFLALQDQGVEVDFCPLDAEGCPNYDALDGLLTPQTRLIVASWVQFFNGYVHDFTRLREAADAVGAWLVSDVTQGVGIAPLDAVSARLDALMLSGHKTLCAPVGSGYFWLAPHHWPAFRTAFTGWVVQMPDTNFSSLTDYRLRDDLDGRRIEIGSDIEVVWMPFLAMLEWVLDVGIAPLNQHVTALSSALAEGLTDRGYRTVPPPAHRLSILSFRTPEADATPALFKRLWDRGVVASLREGWIRLSVHVYNDSDDLARFFAHLDAVG